MFKVQYLATDKILADGFIKVFSKVKFDQFIYQCNLIDIFEAFILKTLIFIFIF